MPPRRPTPKQHIAKVPEGYRDIFGVRDARLQPLILKDCTSIEWPQGWSAEAAKIWRKNMRLEKP